MYKVFLVDDEIVVREGIRNNFPWDTTQFVLAGEAPDGEIALSMIQDIKPDIVITDIRMPFMDGLQLCRSVTRAMPWIYMVILSGYDDFAYAREAISLGVKEYLLKPVSGQELKAVLERISERIRQDKLQQANLLSFKEQFASSSRYLREKLLNDMMSDAGGDDYLERARTLQIDIKANEYLVMLLRPYPIPDTSDGTMSVRSVLQRISDGSGSSAYLCEIGGNFAFLVLGDSDDDLDERAYGLAQAAQYDVQRSTSIKLTVGIGDRVKAINEIRLSYLDAVKVLKHMATLGEKPRIMNMQDVKSIDGGFSLLDLDVMPIYEQLQRAGVGDVDVLLSHYVDSMGQNAAQSLMMANYMYVDIMLAASRMIKESGGVPQEVMPDVQEYQDSPKTLLSFEEVLPMSRDMLSRAIDFRDSQGSARYGGVIRKAKAFIAENYADSNITLHDVASHVALSNNHFCTVFSQEVGVTYTEYITSVRIQKSKELLRQTSMRTSDIAYAVGYNDPHYFSYLFKKNTGVTPRDYRREARGV